MARIIHAASGTSRHKNGGRMPALRSGRRQLLGKCLLAFLLGASLVNCDFFKPGGRSICSCVLPATPKVVVPAVTAPMAVVFLVDRTTAYAHVESDLPLLAIQSIEETIKRATWRAGDTVYGAWMTPQSPALGDDFLPVRTVTTVPQPRFAPQPVAPVEPASQVGCGTYCESDVKNYSAALDVWKQRAEAQVADWNKAQGLEVAGFVDAVTRTLTSIRSPRLDTTAPDVYGALYGASRVFDQHRVDNGPLELVVYSGLIEKSGPVAPLSLGGVQVLVEAYHRHGADYQRAGEQQWRAVFT